MRSLYLQHCILVIKKPHVLIEGRYILRFLKIVAYLGTNVASDEDNPEREVELRQQNQINLRSKDQLGTEHRIIVILKRGDVYKKEEPKDRFVCAGKMNFEAIIKFTSKGD